MSPKNNKRLNIAFSRHIHHICAYLMVYRLGITHTASEQKEEKGLAGASTDNCNK